MEICVVRRAPLLPIGSFTTCTTISCPSCTSAEIEGVGCGGGGGALSPLPSTLPASCGSCGTRRMSEACRNAARSRPISTKAACMPGITRCTRPLYTLPTTPRRLARSMCSSCNMPFSTSATRVSRGVTFIRISSDTLAPSDRGELPQQHPCLVHRQSHHTAVAALDAGDEGAGTALDAIGPGLAAPFAAGHVGGDIGIRKLAEIHRRLRQQVLL